MSEDDGVSINAYWLQWTSQGGEPDHVPMRINGPRSASYRDIVEEGLSARDREGWPFIDYRDPENGELYTLRVDNSATMGEVADALGDEIGAQPATLQLGPSGRGGDAGFTIDAVLEIANDAKQVGEWVGLGLIAWRLAVRRYYRDTRRLAKDWIDTGEISMGLRQAVLAFNPWRRDDFDRVFLLRDKGPELLRTLGYERDLSVSEEMWWEMGHRIWRRGNRTFE